MEASAACAANTPRSFAVNFERFPKFVPMGVRFPATMYTGLAEKGVAVVEKQRLLLETCEKKRRWLMKFKGFLNFLAIFFISFGSESFEINF